MRIVRSLLLFLGIVLLGILVYLIGGGPILETLWELTWWQFVIVCLPYALGMVADTLGWRFAFARDRAPFLRLLGARLAGEAINVITAVGSVGGEAVKAWLVRQDVSYEESVPSVIIAKTTITVAQVLFLVLGIALAWAVLSVDSRILRGMFWMLVVEVIAVGGFVGVQVAGLVQRGGKLLAWFGMVKDTSGAEKLDEALRSYYRHEWGRLSLSVGFHLLGWFLNAVEAFVVLWALGVNASPLTAMVIEALGSAVRFATFLVPASLGTLEGANTGAFVALGFSAGAGLAFSFARRARQAVWIVVGLIALFVMRWQVTRAAPGRRQTSRRSATPWA